MLNSVYEIAELARARDNLHLDDRLPEHRAEARRGEGARGDTLDEEWGNHVAFAAKRWKYWNRRNMTTGRETKRNETMFALRGTSWLYLSLSLPPVRSLSLSFSPFPSSRSVGGLPLSSPSLRTEDLLVSSAF